MNNYQKQFVQISELIGDKARATMLWCMLDGRAYTATELALCADISAQSASNHLKKLISANLLAMEKQGRHRYYRYQSPDVAQVIESMAGLITFNENTKKKILPKPTPITYARTCYDHLAGKFGVALTQALIHKNIIKLSEQTYEVTATGEKWLHQLGIDTELLKHQKRAFAYPCLDWSERKHHIAGALGAAILKVFLHKQWIKKKPDSREISITPKGKIELKDKLNLEL